MFTMEVLLVYYRLVKELGLILMEIFTLEILLMEQLQVKDK